MTSRDSLRKSIRLHRQRLTLDERLQAAHALTERVVNSAYFQTSQNIAAYFPHDGEISPSPILEKAWKLGKNCYLPVINCSDTHQMCFVRYDEADSLTPNNFGILEPKQNTKSVPTESLDLFLIPLVAFDKRGYRLGMGGGYYDRLLAELKSPKPYLVGLAYDFQEVSSIPEEKWDIPLDAVATHTQLYIFQR